MRISSAEAAAGSLQGRLSDERQARAAIEHFQVAMRLHQRNLI